MATETRTRISGEAYERLALAEPDRKWELRDGYPREKPGTTAAHNDLAVNLGYMLMSQLDRAAYRVRIDAGRVHRPGATYFIPDVSSFPPHLSLLFSSSTMSSRCMTNRFRLLSRSGPAQLEIMTSRKRLPPTSSAATWRSGASTPMNTR